MSSSAPGTVESEREQALAFAQRAAILEDTGFGDMAQLFRYLVTLCDMKIAVLNAIDENPRVKMLHTPEGRRKLLD
jgi:hypothetical protein